VSEEPKIAACQILTKNGAKGSTQAKKVNPTICKYQFRKCQKLRFESVLINTVVSDAKSETIVRHAYVDL